MLNLNEPLSLPEGFTPGTAASFAALATAGRPVVASYRSGILCVTRASLTPPVPDWKRRSIVISRCGPEQQLAPADVTSPHVPRLGERDGGRPAEEDGLCEKRLAGRWARRPRIDFVHSDSH